MATAAAHLPGDVFEQEIREQPDALRSLLAHADEYAAAASAIAARRPPLIRLAAHGSSDNAASFGVYAFGLLPGWVAMRDSITLSVYYGADLDLPGSVAIALSQSGRTPDVVEYVVQARRRGALTVAITNDPSSELGRAAEITLPLAAGPERAIAATKTYVNQLAALLLLAGHIAGRGAEIATALHATADLLGCVVDDLAAPAAAAALHFAYVDRMFVIGRGIEYATAREVALKLTETCRIAAGPLTATDLAHGPIAAIDPQFPVWTIASHDETQQGTIEAAARARAAGALLVASGNAAAAVARATYSLSVPMTPLPLLSPLLSVVPGQLFAAALARAKGLDADRPAALSKVTLAR
jgi:glucosamine--fructose-6-phosphate aminotransferase (isomerizing)